LLSLCLNLYIQEGEEMVQQKIKKKTKTKTNVDLNDFTILNDDLIDYVTIM